MRRSAFPCLLYIYNRMLYYYTRYFPIENKRNGVQIMKDSTKTIIKRVSAGILAVLVLVIGILFSYCLMQGYGQAAVPSATPDNSQYVDNTVALPDDAKTPNETLVSVAFVLLEVLLILFIVYVLVRKKL